MFSLGQNITDEQAMQLAIEVARQGEGYVSPNPLVGCVVLDQNNKLVSMGAHLKLGEAHAEVHALSQIQDKSQLKGAKLFVTLEPCSHYGKTPPCVDLILQYPIAKVVYGIKDPNPLVAGRGIQKLKDHGVEVEQAEGFEASCRELCEQFLFHIQNYL